MYIHSITHNGINSSLPTFSEGGGGRKFNRRVWECAFVSLHVWSVKPQNTRLCILWPPSHHSRVSLWSRSLLAGVSFSTMQMFVITHSFPLFVSLRSYEAVLIIFRPHSSPSVFALVPYCYSSLFAFPPEKLASFDGPGKQQKGKLWLALVFLFPYLFFPPPTLCFLVFVLNSSHSMSFWLSLLLLLFSPHPLSTLLLSSLCLQIILNRRKRVYSK